MIDDAGPQPLCPFCGEVVLRGEGSRDHIFGRAFGGKATVAAHRKCNNESGDGAEGDLQRHDTVHNFVKQTHRRGQAVPMVSASGRTMDIDLATGKARSRPVVQRSREGDVLSLRIGGLGSDPERIYEELRVEHPDWGLQPFRELPPGAVTHVMESDFTVTLTMPLLQAEAVAIKAALGACTYAYGPAFPATDLGRALRQRAAEPATRDQQDWNLSLHDLDALVASMAAQVGLTPGQAADLPQMAPAAAPPVQSVVLIPKGATTWLVAHLMSVPTPPYGIRIDAPLPPLTLGIKPVLPILIQDAPDQMEITDFTHRLMQPAIDAIQFAGVADEADLGASASIADESNDR